MIVIPKHLAVAALVASFAAMSVCAQFNRAETKASPHVWRKALRNRQNRSVHAAIVALAREESNLALKLHLTRLRLEHLYLAHPHDAMSKAAAIRHIAIVSEMYGSYIGVHHGTSEHILASDRAIFIRRANGITEIVGEGVTYNVTATHCAVHITRNDHGIEPEDEVYFSGSLGSPYNLTELRSGPQTGDAK